MICVWLSVVCHKTACWLEWHINIFKEILFLLEQLPALQQASEQTPLMSGHMCVGQRLINN